MGSQQILIVGAGFAGATVARLLAGQNFDVTVIDQRSHVAGNAFDYVNQHGIRIHKYGAHLFHSNNAEVVEFLSQFTQWIEYKHRVVAKLPDSSYVTFPPTKDFVDQMGMQYVLNHLYVPYTKKMWGKDLNEIDSSVIDRVPVRTDNNDLYFPNDQYQFLPTQGYTQLIANMLMHEKISLRLNTMFDKQMEKNYFHVFNSMPIDVYYDYQFGELPYRSIKFKVENHQQQKLSAHAVINFTDNSSTTRITEWKNFPGHGNNAAVTTTTREIPCDYRDNNHERYYPVKDADGINRSLYKQYQNMINHKVTFIGRCGQYVYIDMDQAVASSMAIARRFLKKISHTKNFGTQS